MGRFLPLLLKALQGIWKALAITLGTTNATGWAVTVAVAVAFFVVWAAVLHYVNTFLSTYLSSLTVDIFGVGLPGGAVWLINQAFPLQLFFDLTVTLLVFRLTAGKLLMLAI